LQLNPNDANSYYSRGVSYWHLGLKDEAMKDLQSAAKRKHKGAQDFLTSLGVKW
jgi:regulator of sirC expression with transglutaminase-like and TPR domain